MLLLWLLFLSFKNSLDNLPSLCYLQTTAFVSTLCYSNLIEKTRKFLWRENFTSRRALHKVQQSGYLHIEIIDAANCAILNANNFQEVGREIQ